jgi:hypothetical protein
MGEEALTVTPRYQGVMPPNRECLTNYFSALVSDPNIFFVVLGPQGAPFGMLAATSGHHSLTGLLTVSEFLWWVSPGKRGNGMTLLRAMFAWGESLGAVSYQVGSTSKRVDKVLKRFGFRLLESIFIKRVN